MLRRHATAAMRVPSAGTSKAVGSRRPGLASSSGIALKGGHVHAVPRIAMKCTTTRQDGGPEAPMQSLLMGTWHGKGLFNGRHLRKKTKHITEGLSTDVMKRL